MLKQLKIMLQTPHRLLLIDACGAAMTSFATFFFLAGERIETGLPIGLLNVMAIVAACFGCFDILASMRRTNLAMPLRIIASANLSYCIVVCVALLLNRTSVTFLAVAYFCIEISIVASLAVWEWLIASRNALR